MVQDGLFYASISFHPLSFVFIQDTKSFELSSKLSCHILFEFLFDIIPPSLYWNIISGHHFCRWPSYTDHFDPTEYSGLSKDQLQFVSALSDQCFLQLIGTFSSEIWFINLARIFFSFCPKPRFQNHGDKWS